MANTYIWQIHALNAKIKEDEKDNVIFSVKYTYTAIDNSEPPIQAGSIGTLGVEYKEGDPFIEYADLKKSDVVSWIEDGVDVDGLKEQLDRDVINQIKRKELLKNPVDETLYPDWS